MYGFIGGINVDKESLYIRDHNSEELISGEKISEEFVIKRLTLNKFSSDKVFYESERAIIAIEGVIYNFRNLTKKYSIKDRGALLEKIYQDSDMTTLCNLLDGYYSGVLYDKKKKVIYVLTDHIGYRPVWYYCANGTFVFSTDIDWIYHSTAAYEQEFLPDEDAFISMLNYGYVLGDRTLNRSIKKLLPGHYLSYDENKIDIKEYYSLPLPEKLIRSRKDILKEIDDCITESAKKAYEKDEEYGYKHVMTLSGGLDSRVLLFKACQLGYQTTCITMGEANCADIRISSQICDDVKQEHIIYELNNGLYLSDIESAIEANGGTIMWPGFAHGYRLRQLIDLKNYGAIHSGDCGDAIIGGSLYEGKNANKTRGQMDLTQDVLAYGKTFDGNFSDEFVKAEKSRYDNKVLFNYFNRGINSAGNGVYATQYYSEGSSPFMSKQLLSLMYRLPYEYTKEHKLYFDYLKEYMPEACKYIWEHTGCKPGAGYLQKERIKWKRRINYRVLHKYSSMNPYNKWYRDNEVFRAYLDNIYSGINDIRCISDDIIQVINRKYKSNSTMEKMLACVAITVLKKYGANIEHER